MSTDIQVLQTAADMEWIYSYIKSAHIKTHKQAQVPL